MSDHDRALAQAFDGQAAHFERAAVQTDPATLERIVQFADLPAGGRVLDAGCGPGLVSAALLAAGQRVHGVDLSAEMIARARQRCAAFGARAVFAQQSVFADLPGPFDAAVSRLVLHHVADPLAFVRRQADLLRPGGVLVLVDHTTDPDPGRAAWHQGIERGRDGTHTRNLAPGQMADLLALAGLGDIRLQEHAFTLDFDEWFDRGTPTLPKEEVRRWLLAGPGARGFTAQEQPDGAVRIACWLALVRGVR